jgi:hypothetical protein
MFLSPFRTSHHQSQHPKISRDQPTTIKRKPFPKPTSSTSSHSSSPSSIARLEYQRPLQSHSSKDSLFQKSRCHPPQHPSIIVTAFLRQGSLAMRTQANFEDGSRGSHGYTEGCRLSHMGVCQENILFFSVGGGQDCVQEPINIARLDLVGPKPGGSATAQTSFV